MTSETEGVVSDPDDDVAAALDAGEVIDGVVDAAAEDSGVETGVVVSVAVTGQMVVETGMTTVVRTVERAGQLVTSGPQLMMVDTDVVKTVEVVS